MALDIGLMESDGNKFVSELKTQSRSSIQDFLRKLWKTEFTVDRLTGLESVLYELTRREEMLEACEDVIHSLWEHSITIEYHESVASFLLQCIELMEPWKRERLAFHAIQLMREQCTEKKIVFEVFASLISGLDKSKDLSTPIVDRLCMNSWNSSNLCPLLSAIVSQKFQLSSSIVIVRKAFECAKDEALSVENRAASICNLFLLKDQNITGMLIINLNTLIENMRQNSLDEAMKFLEKVLCQFLSTSRKRDFITDQMAKSLKILPLSCVLESFSFGVALLVLSSESKIGPHLLKRLCSATIYTYTSNDRISGSAFLRKVCSPLPDPETVIDQIIGNFSGSGLIGVVEGLMQHCFALLKSAAPTASGGLLGGQNRGGDAAVKSRRALSARKFIQFQQQQLNHASTSSSLSPKSRISRMAINTLTEIFQNFPEFRRSLVAKALNQIWAEPNKPICFQMTELIGELAALCPVEFAEAASETLSGLFDCLGVFSLGVSTALLHALLPLFVVSGVKIDSDGASSAAKGMTALSDLQLRVITTLRKMSTTYSVPVRRIAVAGFISLLKNLRVRSSNFRTASQQSWSMSTQGTASSQSWFNSIATFSQVLTSETFMLYSQIKSTQVAQGVTKLPSNPERNEALCTEIVSLLHRLINSTFFGGTSGTLLNDPSALVKSDIYWGLCEVAVSNRGLVGPVLTLFTRLLAACIDPGLSKCKPVFKDGAFILPQVVTAVPLKLSQLVSTDGGSDSELCYRDHPEILVWCLQILLSLPLLRHHWSRFGQSFVQLDSSGASASSQFTQSSNSALFTQTSFLCGSGGLSMRIFSRAASLVLNLSAALRETALDEFGLTSDIELGSTTAGQANRARLTMLLGLYDACLEFEAKNLLGTVTDSATSWSHLKRLFARRECARKLLFRCSDKDEREEGRAEETLAGDILHTVASNSEVSTNLCFVGTSEGRLRGALLVSGLRSIVGALPRVLLSASTAPTFALHLLQTTYTRLAELTVGGSSQQQQPLLSVVYRSTFVRIVAKILRLTIRFYASYLNAMEETPAITASESATATAALQTSALCFSVVSDNLGSKRLLTLVATLYSVALGPKPLAEDDADCGVDEEVIEAEPTMSDTETDRSTTQRMVANQSRALTALVKLFKGWVTQVLTLTSSTIAVGPGSTQQSMSKSMVNSSRDFNALITDLTILLPMLIRLCEARTAALSATVGSSVTPSAPTSHFSGLDRVLIWLLRLITSKEVFEGKARVQVGAQTMRLALHLARLLGSSSTTGTSDGDRRRSPAGVSALAELTWDDLVVLLAIDIRTALGSIESEFSGDRSSIDSNSPPPSGASKSEEKSTRITFPLSDSKSAANSLFQVLIPALNQALDDVSWLVESITQDAQRDILESGLFVSAQKGSCASFTGLPDARRASDLAVCDMLLTFGEALDELLQTSMQPSFAYEVIRLTTGVFDLLGKLTKQYISLIQRNVGTFPTTFERVVRLFGRQVSPHSYTFVYFVQVREAEKSEVRPPKRVKRDDTFVKPKNPALSKTVISRNLKDAKLIPQLIFAVEQYESLLTTLSKKSKVSLIDNIRMSLSRDFRINQASALAILEAEIEAETDPLELDLPPLSETGIQPEEGEVIDTDNETI